MLEMIMAYAQSYARSITRNEEGQALVEYALILALVSVVAIAALTLIGTNVSAILDEVGAALG